MKIAVAKYPVHAPASFADFAQRITTVLGQARQQGARIAVLPEYLSLELAASLGEPVSADLKASLFAQDSAKVKEAFSKLKQLYSKMFIKFG